VLASPHHYLDFIVVLIFGGQHNFILKQSRLLNVALTATRLQSLFMLFLPAFSYRPNFKPIKCKAGESNGKLPPGTCPGCSVSELYRSRDWALVPAKPGLQG